MSVTDRIVRQISEMGWQVEEHADRFTAAKDDKYATQPIVDPDDDESRYQAACVLAQMCGLRNEK